MITFHLVGLGWVLFRSQSFAAAGRFIQGLVAFNQMIWLVDLLPSIVVTAILIFGIDVVVGSRLTLPYRWMRPVIYIIIIATLVVLIGLQILSFARGSDMRPFIYGQF